MAHTETKHDNPVIERAADDEPLFVLRAHDRLAIAAIEAWITAAMQHHVSAVKVADAWAHRDLMQQWQIDHPDRVKIPE